MATTTRTTAAKKTTAAAKTTRRRTTTPKVVEVALTEDQRQAKLEAYNALKQAGLDIPAELQVVEEWIAELQAQREAEVQSLQAEAQARADRLAEVNQNGPWYVRNGYPAPFNIRLDRQTESRRIQLAARGAPGDLHPILDEDLKDPILKRNLQLGLIEVIPAGEAQLVIENQTTNMTKRVHTPLAILRNELGETYQQGSVKVEAEFNSQGVTVAQVDPRVLQGKLHDREIGGTRGTGGLTRVQPGQEVVQGGNQVQASDQATSVVHSGFVPTGGNPAIIQYGPLGDNAQARVVDDIARRKGLQGPSAGLGNVQVVVDPVVKT